MLLKGFQMSPSKKEMMSGQERINLALFRLAFPPALGGRGEGKTCP